MLFTRERSNYPLSVAVDDTGTGFTITAYAVACPADPKRVCALVRTATAGLDPRPGGHSRDPGCAT